MNKRLDQFMKVEGLTSAKLAEILSVQPSSISHLLSGRNNPNFDFISKLLLMFPRLNPHWIINGDGGMYLDDHKASVAQFSTDNYKSNPTDNLSLKLPEISNQIIDTQTDQTVNSVTPLPDLFAQNSPIQTQPQPETVVEQLEVEDIADVNSSKSVDNDFISTPTQRTVDRVLLLYSDNTFEFFNR